MSNEQKDNCVECGADYLRQYTVYEIEDQPGRFCSLTCVENAASKLTKRRLDALQDALDIVKATRIAMAGKNTVLWSKLNRIESALNSEFEILMTALADGAESSAVNLALRNEDQERTVNDIPLDESGQYEAYVWPGGYPIFYFVDGDTICVQCVNDNIGNESFTPTARDVNYEDASLYCDHCSKRIESAYAEDDAPATA